MNSEWVTRLTGHFSQTEPTPSCSSQSSPTRDSVKLSGHHMIRSAHHGTSPANAYHFGSPVPNTQSPIAGPSVVIRHHAPYSQSHFLHTSPTPRHGVPRTLPSSHGPSQVHTFHSKSSPVPMPVYTLYHESPAVVVPQAIPHGGMSSQNSEVSNGYPQSHGVKGVGVRRTIPSVVPRVAQPWLEREAVNLEVTGSIPVDSVLSVPQHDFCEQSRAVGSNQKPSTSSRPVAALKRSTAREERQKNEFWRDLLARNSFPKVRLRKNRIVCLQWVHRGLPKDLRWTLWKKFVTDGNDNEFENILEACRHEYELVAGQPCREHNQIEVDLDRTFPDKNEYSEYHRNAEEHKRMLRTILNVYGLSDPKLGYCQGMNYLAGLLLVTSGFQEVEAYVLFKLLLIKYGARWFYTGSAEEGKDGFVTFPLFLVFRAMLDELVEAVVPKLHVHLKSFLHFPHHVTFGRFDNDQNNLTTAIVYRADCHAFFVSSFPRTITLMFLDAIWCEGLSEMLRIAVGVLVYFEDSLLHPDQDSASSDEQTTCFEHIYGVLEGIKKKYRSTDPREQEHLGRRILRAAAQVHIPEEMRVNIELALTGHFASLDDKYKSIVFPTANVCNEGSGKDEVQEDKQALSFVHNLFGTPTKTEGLRLGARTAIPRLHIAQVVDERESDAVELPFAQHEETDSDSGSEELVPPPFLYHRWQWDVRLIEAYSTINHCHRLYRSTQAVLIEPFLSSELFQQKLLGGEPTARTVFECSLHFAIEKRIGDGKLVFDQRQTTGDILQHFRLPKNLQIDFYLGVVPTTKLDNMWSIQDLFYFQRNYLSQKQSHGRHAVDGVLQENNFEQDGWLYLFYYPCFLQPSTDDKYKLLVSRKEYKTRLQMIHEYKSGVEADAFWQRVQKTPQLSRMDLYKCSHFVRFGLPMQMRAELWIRFLYSDPNLRKSQQEKMKRMAEANVQSRGLARGQTASERVDAAQIQKDASRSIHLLSSECLAGVDRHFFVKLLQQLLQLHCWRSACPFRSTGCYTQGMNFIATVILDLLVTNDHFYTPVCQYDVPVPALLLLYGLFENHGFKWFYFVPKNLPYGVQPVLDKEHVSKDSSSIMIKNHLNDFPLVILFISSHRRPKPDNVSDGLIFELLRQEDPVYARHLWEVEVGFGAGVGPPPIYMFFHRIAMCSGVLNQFPPTILQMFLDQIFFGGGRELLKVVVALLLFLRQPIIQELNKRLPKDSGIGKISSRKQKQLYSKLKDFIYNLLLNAENESWEKCFGYGINQQKDRVLNILDRAGRIRIPLAMDEVLRFGLAGRFLELPERCAHHMRKNRKTKQGKTMSIDTGVLNQIRQLQKTLVAFGNLCISLPAETI
eukprot:gene530-545_t